MSDPPQVRPEEPIAVTPHDGICGGESQQWLSYPTNPHVRFDERGRETDRCRMAQATAPVLDSTNGEALPRPDAALTRAVNDDARTRTSALPAASASPAKCSTVANF